MIPGSKFIPVALAALVGGCALDDGPATPAALSGGQHEIGVTSSGPTGTAPLWHYYNSTTGDHHYTLRRDDDDRASEGYDIVTAEGRVLIAPSVGTLPIHQYRSPTTVVGYILSTPRSETAPLYEVITEIDRIYSLNPFEHGGLLPGITLEKRVIGHVYP